jgi:magnesium transporter
VLISEPYSVIEDLVSDLQTEGVKNISLGRIMSLFFDKLTFDDSIVLERMEKEITELEEDLLLSKESELIDVLVAFRKKLRTLKRYYEQLLEISEAIEQNENGLIDKTVLRFFRFHTGRVTRLYSGVLNLRDYVTQVREAYQAQMDINLNKVMKFFTVITSVFLPLTLIAGWYGMNLKMPEYSWNLVYPFVIVISIAAAAGSLIYFKKNKWF